MDHRTKERKQLININYINEANKSDLAAKKDVEELNIFEETPEEIKELQQIDDLFQGSKMSSKSRKPVFKVLKDANLRVAEFVVDAYEIDIDVKVEKSPVVSDEWKNHPIAVKSDKTLSNRIMKPISIPKESKLQDNHKILPKMEMKQA